MNKVEDSGGMAPLDVAEVDATPLPDASTVADGLEAVGLVLAYLVTPDGSDSQTVVYIDPTAPVAVGHEPALALVDVTPGDVLADVFASLPDAVPFDTPPGIGHKPVSRLTRDPV